MNASAGTARTKTARTATVVESPMATRIVGLGEKGTRTVNRTAAGTAGLAPTATGTGSLTAIETGNPTATGTADPVAREIADPMAIAEAGLPTTRGIGNRIRMLAHPGTQTIVATSGPRTMSRLCLEDSTSVSCPPVCVPS